MPGRERHHIVSLLGKTTRLSDIIILPLLEREGFYFRATVIVCLFFNLA